MQVLKERNFQLPATPTPALTKKTGRKTPASTRRTLHTPGSKGVQTPNNDEREKEQARIRRSAVEQALALEHELGEKDGAPPEAVRGLPQEQLSMLYQNCLKMASENKITKDNTWALPLIDHISDLVQPSTEEGNQTNFQRASLTLAAGVVIYSQRVDSIHNDAFKVLTGLSRSAARGVHEDQVEGGAGEGEDASGDEGTTSGPARPGKKARAGAADADPTSTLEANFDALNIKKFDLAFAVDPLFHKTSAQFDEGGARGLLLNNLTVSRGCEIMFDSLEVPDAAPPAETEPCGAELVELGGLADLLRKVLEVDEQLQQFPALAELSALAGCSQDGASSADPHATVAQIAREVGAGSFTAASTCTAVSRDGVEAEGLDPSSPAARTCNPADLRAEEEGEPPAATFKEFAGGDADDHDSGNEGPADWGYEGGDDGDDAGENTSSYSDQTGLRSATPAATSSPSGPAASSCTTVGLGDEAVQWLLAGAGGDALGGKDWAGAAHWRFRPTRARTGTVAEEEANSGSGATSSRQKTAAAKKRAAARIDFEALPDIPEGALRQAASKDITLRTAMARADTLLPEDIHYQAKSLMELFLKPGALLGNSQGRGGPAGNTRVDDSGHAWDGPAGDYDGGSDAGDGPDDSGWDGGDYGPDSFGGATDLLAPVQRVAQISVNYARSAKQVDVRALKESLWQGIRSLRAKDSAGSDQEELSFQDLIASLPPDGPAGRLADLSVHLCFICLLHLANEHGLRVKGVPQLDRLLVGDLPPLADEVLV